MCSRSSAADQKALIFSTSSQSMMTQSMTSAMETSLSTRKSGPAERPLSSPFVPFPGSTDR